MTAKQQPTGICDHCLGMIQPGQWYTSKGSPRLYCSIDCRNTANSRAGNPVRVAKMVERVREGTWRNPAKLRPPTGAEQAERARKGRKREIAEGRWRNPGLTPEAREINSRPHKYSGALASAIEKLGAGMRVSDLTPEEQEAHRAYRREQQRALSKTWDDSKREILRAKWREQKRKKS